MQWARAQAQDRRRHGHGHGQERTIREEGELGVLEHVILAQELDGRARRLRLAVLLEDVGVDEVVCLGVVLDGPLSGQRGR